MFETIYSQVLTGFLVLVVGFALVKGDETERIGGAAYALVIIAGVMTSDNSSFSLSRWSAFALDVVLLATFLGLGWQSRRSWPMWAGAFQALIVTGHIMVLANLRPPGDAFAAVNNMANYALLISLAVGTFWAWQERRAAGLKA
ncbi:MULTISPECIES: hypothetical protein [unclassified Brevundimonas]|uniref:hypothetical protein n=1 Tax=unclassified Brevundimonas TaxID=2622653 RepID=UPI000A775215|nr:MULTISPECIES: hypothetical protein [unclassified Brevundimonas]